LARLNKTVATARLSQTTAHETTQRFSAALAVAHKETAQDWPPKRDDRGPTDERTNA
jgi:hypothetical protein